MRFTAGCASNRQSRALEKLRRDMVAICPRWHSLEALPGSFDMTVLNALDLIHLVMDATGRLPQTGENGIYLKQGRNGTLVEHGQCSDRQCEGLRKSALLRDMRHATCDIQEE
jgi:hypothetical protein